LTRRVYVVRENPENALDELVEVSEDDIPAGAVEIVRELGEVGGSRYVHAWLREPVPAWDGRWRLLTHDEDAPFANALIRHRVVAYVTRRDDTELLTIEPEGHPGFVEVPAGRLDHGESLEEGLYRELDEETGFSAVRIVRELPAFECTYRTFSHNHAFHAAAVEETPDEWRHEVHGDGADAGMVHVCRWVPLSRELNLWNEGDPMLRHLPIRGR
jgi:ADP-ribose pyrophosphatase YjhB (NUDIX family)